MRKPGSLPWETVTSSPAFREVSLFYLLLLWPRFSFREAACVLVWNTIRSAGGHAAALRQPRWDQRPCSPARLTHFNTRCTVLTQCCQKPLICKQKLHTRWNVHRAIRWPGNSKPWSKKAEEKESSDQFSCTGAEVVTEQELYFDGLWIQTRVLSTFPLNAVGNSETSC